MIIAFETIELRLLCQNKEELISLYGKDAAHNIIDRLAEMRAAVNGNDILVGTLNETAEGMIEYKIGPNLAIKFLLHQKKFRRETNGAVNWESIIRIKLVGFENGSND